MAREGTHRTAARQRPLVLTVSVAHVVKAGHMGPRTVWVRVAVGSRRCRVAVGSLRCRVAVGSRRRRIAVGSCRCRMAVGSSKCVVAIGSGMSWASIRSRVAVGQWLNGRWMPIRRWKAVRAWLQW